MSATSTLQPTPSSATNNLGGKYLTFALGRESYGVQVLKVREIIRMVDITPIPQTPPYIKGVMNLRGKIIPVADLRLKFALSNAENTENTCIVVVQVMSAEAAPLPIGLVVDGVEEVVNIATSDIEETPDFGDAIETHYILGIAKIRGAVKTLLDIDKVVAADSLERLHQAAA